MRPLDFIVVTGTRVRDISHRDKLDAMRARDDVKSNTVLIHGAAPGIDQEMSELWSFDLGKQWPIIAPWDCFSKLAGPVRNGAIAGAVAVLLEKGFKGRGFAFPDDDSRGTRDCISRLRAVGLEVDVVELGPRRISKKSAAPPAPGGAPEVESSERRKQ